jgi:glycosyltransferase involved in cell wall biosynthesis
VTLEVGLNLFYLQERSAGTGRYARELIPALLDADPELRLTLFLGLDPPAWVHQAPWAADVRHVRIAIPLPAPGARSMPAAVAAQWLVLPAGAARRGLDVVHGLANVIPPIAPTVATVVTIHDLIWTRHPETMGWRGTIGMRVAAPVSGRAADRVIAVSAAARNDIVATLGIPRDKVDVAHHGVDVPADAPFTPASELRDRLGLGDDPVVLCTAGLRSHKNVGGLVEAHARLRSSRARLVLVGHDGGAGSDVRAHAARAGVEQRVHLTGWASDADLEGLYRLADCFVLPSFEEGFGLPVLEAMARGVPVACSDTSSLPEVAGDAALLFDPRDSSAIAGAIDRLLDDPDLRAALAERGRARAGRFTWAASAEATLTAYRRALERPQGMLKVRRALAGRRRRAS